MLHRCLWGALSPYGPRFLALLTPPSSLRPALAAASQTSEDILKALSRQLHPLSTQVEVGGDQALAAGLELVRRSDFDPAHTLSVR